MLAQYKGIPVMLLWILGVVLIFLFMVSQTVFGRHFYAVGGNALAAKLSGIDSRKVLFWAYLIMSFLAAFSGLLVVLGYSEEEAGKIASLAMDFYKELKIYETTAPIEGLLWYSDEKLAEIKCPIDLYSIIYNNGYCALTKINWEEPGMFIEPTYIDWLMQNITEENLEKIKAFYVICLLDSTFLYGTDDYLNAYDTIFSELISVKKMPELLENRRAMAGVLNDESGILADYYAGKYITQAQIDETKAIIDELKAAYLEIIGNVEWLDASQKEILNIRLKKINFQLGKVDNFNLLEDFEIKENGFLTHLALRKSNRLFSQQIRKEGVRMLDITGFPLFDENAFYERKENAIIVGNAFFADEDWWNNSTYEEKMGYFGNTLSHEIGHFLDGSNFLMDVLFIYGLKMGNYGAALASGVSPLFGLA